MKDDGKAGHVIDEEPVSLIMQNIPSYMGGRQNPWGEKKSNLRDSSHQKMIKYKDLQVKDPEIDDGYLEISSANSVIGMSVGSFFRVG